MSNKLDLWSAKNKRDMGASKNVEMNIGNLSNFMETKGKEQQYADVRATVTDDMLKRLRELMNLCTKRLEFFSRLSDDNIPLIVLVALGITTEEDVKSFETMRARGINTYEKTSREVLNIDNDYAREITLGRIEMPVLTDLKGNNIEYSALSREGKLKDWENKLIALEIELSEKKARKSLEPTVSEASKPITTSGPVEISPILDLNQYNDFELDTPPTQQEASDAGAWREVLEVFVDKAEKGQTEVQPVSKDDDRIVYLLANPFLVPEMEGYKVEFINHTNQLSGFTANKRNILVLSKDVPDKVSREFMKFMNGIVKYNDNYRITKLTGSGYTHPAFVGSINLNKEDLDAYFNRYPDHSFTNSGIGEFPRIESNIIEETETTNNSLTPSFLDIASNIVEE